MCKCHFVSEEHSTLGGSANTTTTDAFKPSDVLPTWLVPSHYKVWIAPNLDTFTFDGTVDIHVDAVSSTNKVVLNSKNLSVHKGSVTVGDKRYEATSIVLDEDKETVTFEFAEEIPAGSKAVVHSVFTGVHNDLMAGFYRSSYTDAEGNKRYMVATQFESTDCRQCFPSFDEPALKATFDCTLVVDSELVALANMDEISCVEFTNTAGKKVKEVSFARTPLMSTYLVAFVVGDLEFIETVAKPSKPEGAKPITVRLFTVKGLVNQGTFALEVGARTLEYFSEYFNEAYPLPKCDMVAIPDFSAGAMENWGLITYRNVYLLCDEKNATSNAKKQIAYVVGHELAHQWFGNLVTMSWWNDLWLNEGFATFVGWLATNHLFPEWDVWTGFITSEFTHALNLDGLRSSHPIQVEVNSAKEVPEIFDAISYSKGASVIRMLNDFLGGQKFMDGVRTYLQEFKYRNTITSNLWSHLSASSGEDIGALMHSWTREMGYPLITVESEKYNDEAKTLTVSLSQSRFISGGDVKAEEDQVVWWVPITVVSHLTGKSGATKHVLHGKQGTVTFPYDASAGSFWKLNFGASGLYRVKYLDEQVAKIGQMLQTNLDAFSVGDRIMFLSDALSLTIAGLGSISTLLDMIKALHNDTDYNVLSQIATTLATLRSYAYLEPESVQDGIKSLGRHVFSSKVEQVGYEFPEQEAYFETLKRALAIGAAERSGDASVAAELRDRFNKYVAGDKTALHPELRAIAYRSVLSKTTPENVESTFKAVMDIYFDPLTQASEKDATLASIGAVNSFDHVDRILNTFMFDQEIVRSQDFLQPLVSLANLNPSLAVVRPMLFAWLKANWSTLVARFTGDGRRLGSIMSICAGSSLGEAVLVEIQAFVTGSDLDEESAAQRVKEIEGSRRAIQQIQESVQTKTQVMSREREVLAAWIEQSL
ncbi:peptidase family M1-domain-containing protein [Chytriomyces cf. hyalinus JEL632]|nr:peptidase family M1-domain-containing protein [Chytriomyces cf. hyalinus JEL632]